MRRNFVVPFGAVVCLVSAVACSSSSSKATGGGPPPSSDAGGSHDAVAPVDGEGPPDTGATSDGAMTGNACPLGTELATLPPCADPATMTLDVPKGCTPTVDGVYHEGEWGDAACLDVASDPVYVKYAGSTLYLAWPMTPTCGCPAQLAFNQDGSMTLDGHQIDLGIFDDPNGSSGDASEFTSAPGGWTEDSAVATGIVIANPPNMPSLVTYEIAVPFSQLGITPGATQSVGFAVNHPSSGTWPAGITVPAATYQPSDPGDWGSLTSASGFQ